MAARRRWIELDVDALDSLKENWIWEAVEEIVWSFSTL
jgi:hypothetical protein